MSLLHTSIAVNELFLTIYVAYSAKNNTVDSIRSIWIQEVGREIDVTDIIMKCFEADLNKIVDDTDWREIYRSQKENCSI